MNQHSTSRRRYRLRISIQETEPVIWRTVDLADDLTLLDLHMALQLLFGWRESHLHEFENADPGHLARRAALDAGGAPPRRWALEDPEDEREAEPEISTTLREAFSDGGPIFYTYDFGDLWIHKIDLLEDAPLEPHEPIARLHDGALRGPFEDSGGPHGYAEKQAILADPQHPQHMNIAGWVAYTVGPWAPTSPDFFDALGLQRELNVLFSPDSGGDPSDMSGLVSLPPSPDGIGVDAPLVDLVGALPVSARVEMRAHLHRTGVLEPELPDAETLERMMRPFVWLLGVVGLDGLTLTKAGWMPPDVVLDGLTTLGWNYEWLGAGHREDHSVPIRRLREQAQRMGIVHVRKGKLLLGAAAKPTIGDPLAIWRLVTSRVLRKLPELPTETSILLLLTLADGSATGYDDATESVNFGLNVLGWDLPYEGFTASQVHGVALETVAVLLAVGALPDLGRDHGITPEGRLFARAVLRGYP